MIVERGQWDERHAVRKRRRRLPCYPHGEARLPDAAGAGQSEQAGLGQEPQYLRDLPLSSHERGRRHGGVEPGCNFSSSWTRVAPFRHGRCQRSVLVVGEHQGFGQNAYRVRIRPLARAPLQRTDRLRAHACPRGQLLLRKPRGLPEAAQSHAKRSVVAIATVHRLRRIPRERSGLSVLLLPRSECGSSVAAVWMVLDWSGAQNRGRNVHAGEREERKWRLEWRWRRALRVWRPERAGHC